MGRCCHGEKSWGEVMGRGHGVRCLPVRWRMVTLLLFFFKAFCRFCDVNASVSFL
jgi:hypothetical protein